MAKFGGHSVNSFEVVQLSSGWGGGSPKASPGLNRVKLVKCKSSSFVDYLKYLDSLDFCFLSELFGGYI